MYLCYEWKEPTNEILSSPSDKALSMVSIRWENMLIEGDNYQVMKCLLPEFRWKVDLIYIDPPFSTNTVFKMGDERTSTVSFSASDKEAYSDKLKGAEFIEFLRKRVILLKEFLSERGSIYLHIDYKIGHYVKLMMDEIFGQNNFRNDITRIKCNPKNFKRKGYGNIKDMILFYSKTNDFIWNEPMVSFTNNELERLYTKKDKNGKSYTTVPLHAPGETLKGESSQERNGLLPPKWRHRRCSIKELQKLSDNGLIEWSKNGNPRKIVYMSDAKKKWKRVQDIWEFKDKPYPSYPTEKNLDLIDLIIKTSSSKGSIVMDCFAWSGTTLIASQKNERKRIGIDQSSGAIKVIKERLDSKMANDYSYGKLIKSSEVNDHCLDFEGKPLLLMKVTRKNCKNSMPSKKVSE